MAATLKLVDNHVPVTLTEEQRSSLAMARDPQATSVAESVTLLKKVYLSAEPENWDDTTESEWNCIAICIRAA
ncbi:MAG: hypothetical protein AB8A40_08175 [Prochlorococcus sp.]|jgi:hypothetical protein|tara:strand:+ start:1001 stop:1219 length:219 start_codon:yes stop_codon:yes gene_type:complete